MLIGPALHLWYGSLGSIVRVGGTAGALARLALDQLAFAPVFISGYWVKVAGVGVVGV